MNLKQIGEAGNNKSCPHFLWTTYSRNIEMLHRLWYIIYVK